MVADALHAPWWKWALFSLAITVVDVVFAVGGMLLVLFQGVDVTPYIYHPSPPAITSGMVAFGFTLLVVGQTVGAVVVLPLFRPARLTAFAGLTRPKAGMGRRIGVGILLLLAVQAVWSAVGPRLPATGEQWRMVDHLIYATAGGAQFWPLFWLLVTVVVLGPVGEELLFRGMAFGLVRRRWGYLRAALATAVVFGLAHGVAGAVPAAVLGFYLAYQTEKDESLLGAITLHMINNFGAVAILFLQPLGR